MSISSNKPGSYPGVLITVSLTIALFLIGFCGWVAFTSKELIKYVKQNIEVQVYLENDLDSAQIAKIKSIIIANEAVAMKDNQSLINFISKEEIAGKFVTETKEDYKEILGNNPFHDLFNLKIKENYLSQNKLAKLKTELESVSGVYEVDYAKDFVNGITENANKAYIIMSAIVIIFLLATILLINNTIKLALYSQRFLIRTMQLVGATNGFIQKPFLLKGVYQGLIAGVIASMLVFLTQQLAVKQISGLSLIQNNYWLIVVPLILLILGPLIGVVSTFQSISRYLSIDLDELY